MEISVNGKIMNPLTKMRMET